MVITIASEKGGVGKTTTAIHLAAILSEDRPTLLIDGDRQRTALKYAARGAKTATPLPFDVVPKMLLPTVAERFPASRSHLVIDTRGGSDKEELVDAVTAGNFIVIPTEADTASIETLPAVIREVEAVLKEFPGKQYGVLLTNVPPAPQKDGALARAALESSGFCVFKTSMRSYKAYRTALSRGVTVGNVRDDPRSVSAWMDCEAFGNEILNAAQRGTLR